MNCTECRHYGVSAQCANWRVSKLGCVGCEDRNSRCIEYKPAVGCGPFGQYKACRGGGRGEKLEWEATR